MNKAAIAALLIAEAIENKKCYWNSFGKIVLT
jgi:hypothetical protein